MLYSTGLQLMSCDPHGRTPGHDVGYTNSITPPPFYLCLKKVMKGLGEKKL